MGKSIARSLAAQVALSVLVLNLVAPPELVAVAAQERQLPVSEVQIEQLERAFDALEDLAAGIRRDTFDPEAILDLVDPEIEPLFEWVRDNTALVPYRGALRGPVGVLMDRVGNSMDRALLLDTLLRLVGYETRLANGRLLPEAARDLLAFARQLPEEEVLEESAATEERALADLRSYAAEFGLDERRLLDAHRESARLRRDLLEESRKRVRTQTEFLAELIGAPSESAVEAVQKRQLATLEDHWWVQVQDGRRWIDLDPSYPTAPMGWAPTVARRTVAVEGITELNREDLHTVQIRLILECWQDGSLTEHTLLESAPLLPADSIGKPLALHHLPVEWPSELDLLGRADLGSTLLETATRQDFWVPVLAVGSERVASQAFRSSCELSPASEALDAMAQVGKSIERKARGLAGAVAALGGSAEEGAGGQGAPGRITAEWIEYEIRTPGEEPERVRRQIFDLIGTEARHDPVGDLPPGREKPTWPLALIGKTDLLLLGSGLSPAFVEERVTSALLALRAPVRTLLEGGLDVETLEALPNLEIPAIELLALALLRRQPGTTQLKTFVERPNVVAFHRQLELVGDDELATIQAFDIVTNRVGAVERGADSAWRARLAQGVIDSNAEALLAAALCDRSTSSAECRPRNNLADVLSARPSRGQWAVVRSRDDLDRLAGGASRSEVIRLEEAMGEGTWLVTPSPGESPDWTRGHWWRVDPVRGDALTIDDRGWGSVATEYLAVVGWVIRLLFTAHCAVSGVKCVQPMGLVWCALGAASLFAKAGVIASLVGSGIGFVIGSVDPGMSEC